MYERSNLPANCVVLSALRPRNDHNDSGLIAGLISMLDLVPGTSLAIRPNWPPPRASPTLATSRSRSTPPPRHCATSSARHSSHWH